MWNEEGNDIAGIIRIYRIPRQNSCEGDGPWMLILILSYFSFVYL